MKQMINLNKMLIVCMMTVGYVIQGRAQEKWKHRQELTW